MNTRKNNELIEQILELIRRIYKDEKHKAICYEDIPKRLRELTASPWMPAGLDGGPPRRRPPYSVITGGSGGDGPHDKGNSPRDEGHCNNEHHAFLAFVQDTQTEDVSKEFLALFQKVETRLSDCRCKKRTVFFFFPNSDSNPKPKFVLTNGGENPTCRWTEDEPPVTFIYYLLTTPDNPVKTEIKFFERPPVQAELGMEE